MTTATKYVLSAYKLLNRRTQVLNIVNVRHFPRGWSHRRPARIVVNNEIAKEEKDKWKLNVEQGVAHKESGSSYSALVRNERTFDSASSNHTVQSEPSYEGEKEIFSSKTDTVKETQFQRHRENKFMGTGESSNHFQTEHVNSRRKYSPLVNTPAWNPGASGAQIERSVKNSLYGNQEKVKPPKVKSSKNKVTDDVKKMNEINELKDAAAKLGVPVFTDLETNDTILSGYMTDLKSKKLRQMKNKTFLEGKRLICDAVHAGIIPEAVFFSRLKDLKDLNLPQEGVKIYKIIYKKLSMWSDVTTSPGVLAVLNIPDFQKKKSSLLPLTVICDNVRDPGNMGSILRTCAGVGCQEVILTKGCTDPWDPKVLRAGAGAHFRLAIQQNETWETIADRISQDGCVFVAESSEKNPKEDSVNKNKSNSSDGGNSGSSVSNSDSGSDSDDVNVQECGKGEHKTTNFMSPVVPYYSIDYSTYPSLALIVGGETHGVSPEAYTFASEVSGIRVNVPLENNVESLNTGIALSVIAFEMKKQFLMKLDTKTDSKERTDSDEDCESRASIKST